MGQQLNFSLAEEEALSPLHFFRERSLSLALFVFFFSCSVFAIPSLSSIRFPLYLPFSLTLSGL